ncbi:MAG: transglycosylase SLT domain-containing protein [Casimicrobiaceae bacterium]
MESVERLRGAPRWLTAVLLAAGTAQAQPAANDVTAELLARALAYEHGEGVARDPQKAVELYCVAARDGNAEAQYSLGWMYANGRGVPHDEAIAATFFSLAARSGHAYAERMLLRAGETRGELPDCMKAPEVPPELPALEEPDPFLGLSPQQQKIADAVISVAPRFGIEPRLALAVVAVESNFVPTARSVKDARGLMQLIPDTAERFNVRNPYNVDENVRGGLTYLRWLLAYYKGQVALAAAAYNSGEATVDRYRGIPPYPETREYVKRVLALFRKDSHPYDSRVVAPSPMLALPDAPPTL